jgi:hypothetical protein
MHNLLPTSTDARLPQSYPTEEQSANMRDFRLIRRLTLFRAIFVGSRCRESNLILVSIDRIEAHFNSSHLCLETLLRRLDAFVFLLSFRPIRLAESFHDR